MKIGTTHLNLPERKSNFILSSKNDAININTHVAEIFIKTALGLFYKKIIIPNQYNKL